MNTPIDQLSALEYELLNKCIAWHVRPHRQVFLEGLATISTSLRFDNLNVLELGATAQSTLSPFLVALGANSTATCYSNDELPKLDETLSRLARQYGLARERLRAGQTDIFALDQKTRFDLVVLKDVLGGVNRQHNQAEFRKAVSNCLSILNPNGHLLIIDKARSLKVIQLILRKMGSAGRNEWHYFTFDELKQLIPKGSFETVFAAHGILSFGDFGGGIIQKVADFLDEHCVERLVPLEKRVVFSLVAQRKLNQTL
jgi:SAM-dependent methyltransferase